MLQITIPGKPSIELWNEKTERFEYSEPTKERTIQLEHSLVSLQKWEAKWCKPFLSKDPMTVEETVDYVRCMTITQNVPSETYDNLSESNIKDVEKYINAPMTATWFSDDKSTKRNNEAVTAEIIYHWMIALNIPHDYRKWHLNSLLTLIRVCNIKNSPPKKMGNKAIMSQNAAINAARRKRLNTKG